MKENEKRTENNRIKRSARIYSDIHLPMTKTETLFLTPLWNGQGTMRMERWNFSFRCFKCRTFRF